MTKLIISLVVFILLAGTPLANAGSFTAHNYFWKPAYRESGPAAYSSYNAALDATDLFLYSLEGLTDLVTGWVGVQSFQAATYVTTSQFTVVGDLTSKYSATQWVLFDLGVGGLVSNIVTSSSFGAGVTTVNVTTANLTANLVRAQILNPTQSYAVMASDYGTNQAALAAADAVAVGAGKSLIVTGAWTIATPATFSAKWEVKTGAVITVNDNVTLASVIAQPGTSFAIATAKTLTINGTLDSDPYQVFSCSGTGKVVFAAGAVKEIHPEWWTTNTTPGTTDMTAAILAAYTAAKNAGRGKVKLLANQYAVADLIFPSNATPWLEGILIEGSGQGTKIIPAAGHTGGNFLMTFQGIGEIAGVGQSGTGWVTLSDFYIDGGSADLKGILIQPSNNFRLRDITFLSILGTALEAERPYDLYCTRLRIVSCGSFADNEAAVRMIPNPIGTATGLSWGNQVYWTDCNIEAYQYRGLELIGCSAFNGRGGKVHGSIKTVATSLGNVYVKGGGEIRFTDVSFSHPHRAPALLIEDEYTTAPLYYSQVALSQCTFSQCESYDAGYDLKVVHYAAKHAASQLAINGCTFNSTIGGIGLGTNGRFIYMAPGAVLWRANIGNNLYNNNTRATIMQDDRAYYSPADAPTYVSTTEFTLPGNYTNGLLGVPALSAGQGVSAVLAGGTVYGTITITPTYAAPNTTVTVATDSILTDPITSVTFYDRIRHTGAIAPEVHAMALTLGHDTAGGELVTLANDILDIRNSASAYIRVDPEGAATSDNMARIVGGRIGSVMVLKVALYTEPVTVKHGTGNIYLRYGVDNILNNNKKSIVLFNWNGAEWIQIGGSTGIPPVFLNNAAAIAGGLMTGDLYTTDVATDPQPVYTVR